MPQASARRQISVVAGVILSLIFVGYSLYNLDWQIFSRSFAEVNLKRLILFNAVLLLTMFLRAWRWHIITGLPDRDKSSVWRASCIGYMGTAIFPARAGEVMRVIHLQRISNASMALAIVSSVVDRLVDAVAICILIGAGLLIFVSGDVIERRFLIMVCIIVAASIVMAAFLLGGHRLHRAIDGLDRFGAIGSRIEKWMNQAFTELQALRAGRTWRAIIVIQVFISCLDVFACWLLFWAFGWALPLTAALFTLICLAVASALPSTPGYVGVYQIAAMAALSEFGIAPSEALAYGTLLQVCNFSLFLIVGIWAYFTAR